MTEYTASPSVTVSVTELLRATSPNADQFSHLFHQQIHCRVCSKLFSKYPLQFQRVAKLSREISVLKNRLRTQWAKLPWETSTKIVIEK